MKPSIKSTIWNIRKQKPPNQNSKEEKRIQISGDSVRSLWDNVRHSNILLMGVPEGGQREQEIGNLFEKIMPENFPHLVKEVNIQVKKLRESQTR